MSKERLEEFREFVDFMYESIDIEDHQRFIAISDSMLNDGWFKWIYRLAKEQSERVQEIEDIIYQDERQAVLEGMYEQNKRYREALEFYAEQDNYEWETTYRPQQEIDCMVIDDGRSEERRVGNDCERCD